MDRRGTDPRLNQLCRECGVKVDARAPGAGYGDEPGGIAARARERGNDLLADLKAAPEDRGSERRDEVRRRKPVGGEAGDGSSADAGSRAAPAGMDRGDRSRLRMNDEDRNAIRRAHGGNRSFALRIAGAVGAVRLGR